MKRNARGFTLVEILIVVIILGILAAIVIPQFTNASNDARTNSTSSTLQTIRSQIELFKIQHGDIPPQTTGMAAWVVMVNKSSTNDTGAVATVPTGTNFGPYLQQAPTNPLNKNSGTSGTASDSTTGWYYASTASAYTIYPRSSDGTSITTY